MIQANHVLPGDNKQVLGCFKSILGAFAQPATPLHLHGRLHTCAHMRTHAHTCAHMRTHVRPPLPFFFRPPFLIYRISWLFYRLKRPKKSHPFGVA